MQSQEAINYLSLVTGCRLSYKQHLWCTFEKAVDVTKYLTCKPQTRPQNLVASSGKSDDIIWFSHLKKGTRDTIVYKRHADSISAVRSKGMRPIS